MTPDEQQMISALFERIGNVGRVDKDYDAEKLIKDQVRRLPDAPYVLVQSVLVQEEALAQADARIQDLESQLAQLLPPDRQRGGGSFLRRGGASPNREQPPFVSASGARPSSGTQSPWGAQPADQPPPQRGGGGFLASALSTAAGVTGGMLAAESLRGIFGGGGGGLFGGHAHADDGALQRSEDRAQDAEQDLNEAQSDLAADDAALDEQQDNSDDQGGGGDDGGGIDV